MKKQLNLILAIVMSASMALPINGVMAEDEVPSEKDKINQNLEKKVHEQGLQEEIEKLKKDFEAFKNGDLVEKASEAYQAVYEESTPENYRNYQEAVKEMEQAAVELYKRVMPLKSKIEKYGKVWAEVVAGPFLNLMDNNGLPIVGFYKEDGRLYSYPFNLKEFDRAVAEESQREKTALAVDPTCADPSHKPNPDEEWLRILVKKLTEKDEDKDKEKDTKVATHEEERSIWPYVVAGGINVLSAVFSGSMIDRERKAKKDNLKRIDRLELLSVMQGRNPIDLQRLRFLEMGRNDYLQYGLQGVARGTQGVLDAVMAYQNPQGYAYMITNRNKWDRFADTFGGRNRSDNGYGKFSSQANESVTRETTLQYGNLMKNYANALRQGLGEPLNKIRGDLQRNIQDYMKTMQMHQSVREDIIRSLDMGYSPQQMAKVLESLDRLNKAFDLTVEDADNQSGISGQRGSTGNAVLTETRNRSSSSAAESRFRSGR